MFRLTEEAAASLARRPESGMGYQLVQARVNYERAKLYFVFNSEILVEPRELDEPDYLSPEEMISGAASTVDFDLVDILPLSALSPPMGGPGTLAGPVAPAPRIRRQTLGFEGFARVSAWPNDWRIAPDGSVTPGTWTTTIEDLRLVPSGFAAAGRYALPNPAAARYVYIIVPGPNHMIDGGTVRPAYNQAGGGVEVQFVNGAPSSSAFKPYRIPEL